MARRTLGFGQFGRAFPVRGKEPVYFEARGWRGMYDTLEDRAVSADEAALLINLIPSDTERGGPVHVRSGRVWFHSPSLLTAGSGRADLVMQAPAFSNFPT